ncbi:MAG: DUF4114 domain-containing protein [Deltaproteobacteria bacterium]|nr:DUF4114 domain-containing protein [Deltaproteobacteria bacterium]
MRRASVFLLLVLLAGLSAHALNQPGGPEIPVGDALAAVFRAQGEAFDVRREASVTPERFVPGCSLTFTLLTRGDAAFMNTFGWYNVVSGRRPEASDLHPLIPCTARPGESFTLDLRREAAYRGGEIGFFLKTPEDARSGRCAMCCATLAGPGEVFYSERAYNPDNRGPDASYIHLLIYDSRARMNAFYFAWEDLFSGGDNNFTDFVARVDNIVCTGGGGACDTGRPGACAAGVNQCRAGRLQCVGVVSPSSERCDGVDNNCDGMTDEGDGLCPPAQLCARGTCVDRCRSELGCFEGEVCTDRGACVEAACARMECPNGQRCTGGRCVGACDGVSCPRGQLCRAGRCVDPCGGVTCDGDQACVRGVCVPRCECRRCASGETCGADGRCRPMACATVACAAGQSCEEGRCRDDCEGARCPAGERCERGACVAPPPIDGGAPRDAATDLGAEASRDSALDRPAGDALDAPSDAAVAADRPGADSAMEVALDAPEGVEPPPTLRGDEGGCGCRAAAAGLSGPGLLALGACALALRRRRAPGGSRREPRRKI